MSLAFLSQISQVVWAVTLTIVVRLLRECCVYQGTARV